jgi:membrane-bound ClpP family serine protease
VVCEPVIFFGSGRVFDRGKSLVGIASSSFYWSIVKLILLIAILALFALIALAIVIALYRHKRASLGEVRLMGELCQVNTNLAPEGTVIVQGELWPARSIDGTSIAPPDLVRVVGTQDHLLLVKVHS